MAEVARQAEKTHSRSAAIGSIFAARRAGKTHAQSATSERDHQAVSDQFTGELRARGAQRDTQRGFAEPCERATEQE